MQLRGARRALVEQSRGTAFNAEQARMQPRPRPGRPRTRATAAGVRDRPGPRDATRRAPARDDRPGAAAAQLRRHDDPGPPGWPGRGRAGGRQARPGPFRSRHGAQPGRQRRHDVAGRKAGLVGAAGPDGRHRHQACRQRGLSAVRGVGRRALGPPCASVPADRGSGPRAWEARADPVCPDHRQGIQTAAADRATLDQQVLYSRSQAQNSFIKFAIDQGYTLFVISWANPGPSLSHKTLENYLDDWPRRAVGGEQVAGECGATRIKAAAFFTTTTDFAEAGELGVFIDDDQLDLPERPHADRYPEVLHAGLTDAANDLLGLRGSITT